MSSQSSYLQELTSHEGRLRDCWQVWAADWLWASDLCSLANDLFRICWKFSSVWQSAFSRARDSNQTEAILFPTQPQRWLLHSVGDINSSPSGKRLQKGFHTRRLRSLETMLEAVYLSFLPPSNLPPSSSSTALTCQSSLAYSQTSVYKTLETV